MAKHPIQVKWEKWQEENPELFDTWALEGMHQLLDTSYPPFWHRLAEEMSKRTDTPLEEVLVYIRTSPYAPDGL